MPNETGTAERGRYTIDSVDNAARILLMLSQRPWIRVTDIARELDVARSTAHRMVSTLRHRGLLRFNADDKSYGPGYRLVELGMAVIGIGDLASEAMPFLAQVASETGETAHLIVREGDEIVFVAVVEGGHVIRAASRVGARVPAHATAAGKVLLSALDDDELAALYPSPALPACTPSTVRTVSELKTILRDARLAGYAVNNGESEDDLSAVSAPIVDVQGSYHGAISLSGPRSRVSAHREEYIASVRGAARGLERRAFGATR